MATNQELRMLSLLEALGLPADSNISHDELWMRFWDQQGVAQMHWNGRMLAWINTVLGTSYTNVNDAMNAFAVSQSYLNWSSMGTFDAGGQFVGILDELSTAPVGAWSIARRLTADYEGNLVRVRRDNDNATEDFGYDGDGNLDTAAITTWLAGANPYVARVYDQIGAANLVQTTAAWQLALNMSEAALGSRACGDLSGLTAAPRFMVSTIGISDATLGLYGVMNEKTSDNGFPRLVTTSADTNQILWLRSGNDRGFFTGGAFKSKYGTAVSLPQAFYFATECDGTNNRVYYRGQAQTQVAYTSNFSFTTLATGDNPNSAGNGTAGGAFAEMYLFADPLGGTDRSAVFANQVSFFSLTPL